MEEHGFGRLPCIRCGTETTIRLELDDFTLTCVDCDADFAVSDIEDILTKWTQGRMIAPMDDCILIIDATNYVVQHWMGSQGSYPSARALCHFAAHVHKRYSLRAVHFAFDGGGRTFRHELFAGYKAGRTPKPQALIDELELAYEQAQQYGHVHRLPGVEADDIIATLTTESSYERKVVIFSRDKDLRQLLVDGRVSLITDAHANRGDYMLSFLTASDLLTRTRIGACQWADYQALAGESDGWPGADGVGEKTATKLIVSFGHLAGIKNAVADWPASLELSRAGIKLTKRQAAGIRKLDIELARKITRLRTDIPLGELAVTQ